MLTAASVFLRRSRNISERWKRDVITICNGADAIVYVELHPIQMVRRTKARKKNFGVGVNTAPLKGAVGVNLQVRRPLINTLVEML